MPLPSFADLFRAADDRAPRTPIVAASGADPTVIEALTQAAQRGWVEPILADSRPEIERIAWECDCDLDAFRILDAAQTPVAAASNTLTSQYRRILPCVFVPASV